VTIISFSCLFGGLDTKCLSKKGQRFEQKKKRNTKKGRKNKGEQQGVFMSFSFFLSEVRWNELQMKEKG
jgi:hypothetical protein